MEESLKSLSMDYLNLLFNGQSFSDVTFSVEGRIVHAHRCVLATRSLFFRKFFSSECGPPGASGIPVSTVGYKVFMLMLQFLYSGQLSVVPQKQEARPDCSQQGCWHTHCTSAVDLALDTLAAARAFGVEQLALLTQEQLAIMVEKASIDDVMKVLISSRKHVDMQHLWNTCSHLVAKSDLPTEVLAKHLPPDTLAKIDELRLKSSSHFNIFTIGACTDLGRALPALKHPLLPKEFWIRQRMDDTATTHPELDDHYHYKIHRMRHALDSSDIELIKLMVMAEGLNLDAALALHYAVGNCSREVVKALLELGAADVNYHAGAPGGKTPLHVAAEMACPDMVAVLLDHHADPNIRTVDGVTPLDVLRSLMSDFLFRCAGPGFPHVEPNKLRLCVELVQSAAMVMSRENNLNLDDSRMVYLNLGMGQRLI